MSDYKQCFMCRGWQNERFMRKAIFEGGDEMLCISCYKSLLAREQQLQTQLDQLVMQEQVDEAIKKQAQKEAEEQASAPVDESEPDLTEDQVVYDLFDHDTESGSFGDT